MRRVAVRIFLVSLVVYHINGRSLPEVDCVAAPYTAWSLVRQGSFDLRFYPELRRYLGNQIRELSDGSWVSMIPPGSAFAVIPFAAPIAVLYTQPLRASGMHGLGKLAAAVSVAGAVVFFFLICQNLVPGMAWPATFLFAFGTCLWSVASQAIWMHGPATFWLCCGLYFLSRDEGRSGGIWNLAAGTALGLAVLTRPTTAFFLIATAGALLAQRKWKAVTEFVVGATIPVGYLIVLNWVQFDSAIFGGYATVNWAQPTPLWLGLTGLLVAPSRGLLVYSPALIFVLHGVVSLIRGSDARVGGMRPILLAWLAAAGVTLSFYARWDYWWGGWTFGPRYLVETMPVLCLVFAIGYAGLQKSWQRNVVKGLVFLSIAVQFVGVFGRSGYAAWQVRHDLPDQGRSMFELRDTQIEAHTRALVGKLQLLIQSPIDR